MTFDVNWLMTRFVDDPQALPRWRYVFVCRSQRCLDERVAELKGLERRFPQYRYTYRSEQIGDKYVIRLVNVTKK
jgi:hypothetical protein